jgi:hypothetical protein
MKTLRLEDHAVLVLLGHAKPFCRKQPEDYLQASGWSQDRDNLGEFWTRSEDKAPWCQSTAITMQQCIDATVFLESRGWEITSGYRCERGWSVAWELRDPSTRRLVKSWSNAVRTQLERDAELLQETISRLDPPNAPCVLERGHGDQCNLWIVQQCPLCGREHTHGGGPSSGDPRNLLGHRSQHCVNPPPGAHGYFLTEYAFGEWRVA